MVYTAGSFSASTCLYLSVLLVVMGYLCNGSKALSLVSGYTGLPVAVTLVLCASGAMPVVMVCPLLLCSVLVASAMRDTGKGTGKFILPLHFGLILVCMSVSTNYTLLSIVILDMLSVLQAIVVFTPLSAPYMLFQVWTSVCIWVSVVNLSSYFLMIALYAKLGLSIGALYLPSLYRQLSLYSLPILTYVGSSNLTLMLYVHYLISSGTGCLCLEEVCMFSPLTTTIVIHASVLPLIWIFSGHVYSGILPYSLAISTTLYATGSFLVSVSSSYGNTSAVTLHALILTGALSYIILVYTLAMSHVVSLPSKLQGICERSEQGLEYHADSSTAPVVNLVQVTRSDYGGRNSTLCIMFPTLVCTMLVYVCYICHTSHPDSIILIVLTVGWLWLIMCYIQAILIETRLLHTALSRASTQTGFAWLVLLEIAFFFGAIWSLSIALTHAAPLSPSLTGGSISIENSDVMNSTYCASQLDSGIVTTSPFLSSKQTETLHLAYTSLCVLLAVTLILQYYHRSIQFQGTELVK